MNSDVGNVKYISVYLGVPVEPAQNRDRVVCAGQAKHNTERTLRIASG